MSTILKALRRLEEDRHSDPSRSLREAVASGGDEDRRRRRGGWLLGLLVLVVGAGASGGTYWWITQAEAPQITAQSAVEPRVEPVAVVTAPPESEPTALVEVADAAADDLASLASETDASPLPSPSRFAPSQELSLEALQSPVEMVKRPPAQPRIAAPDPQAGALVLGSASAAGTTPAAASRGSRRPGSDAVPLTRLNVEAALDQVKSREPVPPRIAGVSHSRSTPAAGDPWDVAVATDAEQRSPSRATPAPVPARSEPPASKKAATARDSEKSTSTSVASRESSTTSTVAASRESSTTSTVRASVKAPPTSSASGRSAEPPTAAARGSERPSSRSGSASSEAVDVAAVSKPSSPSRPAATPAPAAAASRKSSGGAAVPGVRVEKTSWHPSSERRTALIEVDGSVEEIQEGDSVGPLVVSTIEPSGVVFDHDGLEIRRRVGE